MARTPQAGERARLAGDHNNHVTFSVLDHLGAWHDLTSYVTEIRFGETIDTKGQDGTVTLLRSLDTTTATSISPYVAGATLNNIGGTFVPLVDGGRFVMITTNASAVGAGAGTFREVFFGRISNPDVGDANDPNTMTIAIADNAARMMDNWIQVERDYGSTGGTAIETVMQQIIADNPNADGFAPTLVVPVSPGVMLHKFTQSSQPVLDALKALAAQIGWDVRFIYSAADVLQLVLYEPDRTKTVADFTFSGSEYYALPQFTANTDDIRTVGVVRFLDHATGSVLQATASAPGPVIAQYGTKYLEVSEDSSSVIDSMTEAQAMIDAIITDLGQPYATQVIELEYFPLVQLGDLATFTANGVHYDVDQTLAVVGIAHSLTANGDTTTLTCRGRVAGAYKNWLLLHGQALQGSGPTGTEIYLSNFRIVARDALSVTYGWDDTPNAIDVWGFDKTLPLPVAVEPWPDLTLALAPDFRLASGPNTLKLDFPAEGFQRFVQLDPRSATFTPGDQHRVVLFPAGAPPTFGKLTQNIAASGLFAAITVDLEDPQNLGGTFECWVNRSSPNNADPSGAADATFTVSATPYTLTAFDVWSNGITQLSNIQVHPGRGKVVYFRFTNTKGTSSGIQSFQILSEGGIIDENGDLLPGQIKNALQFANTIQPVQIFVSTLPGSGADGTFAFLTSTGKIYRRTGGAWTAAVDGADIIAHTVVAGSIAAGAIGAGAIAAGAITASLLSISVLSAVSPDLGVIVAGSLTSISGAITLNLNATGTSPVLSSAAFSILANGSATFSGTLNAAGGSFDGNTLFAGSGLSCGVANRNFGTFPTMKFVCDLDPAGGIPRGVVGTIGPADYTNAHGQGMSFAGACYMGTAAISALYLGGQPCSFGAANSGGAGFRQVIVPN